MYANKPIIGLVGGIGSGKSTVAQIFATLGCMVVDSDAQVREAYRDPAVTRALRGWWGDDILHPDGSVNRSAVAAKVFVDPAEKKRLEQLLHPMVHAARERQMEAGGSDTQVVAFVWDTPLLFEAGVADMCDAVVFVDTPVVQRLARVKARSGWDASELHRREKSQMPLDTKRSLSDYSLSNTADVGSSPSTKTELHEQVRQLLSQVLNRSILKPGIR